MANPKQLGAVLMIVAGALLIIGICIAIVYGDNGGGGGSTYTSPACIRRGERHFRMLGRDPDGRFESIEIEAECRRSSRAFAE